MTLPGPVRAYLQDWLYERAHPYCYEIDKRGHFVRGWGNAEHYRLGGLAAGVDMLEYAPFLADFPPGEDAVLPHVTDPLRNQIHVHLLTVEGARHAIYLDATAESEQRREAQQTKNEARLLADAQRKLIAQLVDLRAEVDTRRRDAEAESRRKGEYIATMSHEFRTPLAAVLGYAELLVSDDLSDEDRRQHAAAIRRVVREQLALVDNLLEQAKIEAAGSSRETVTDLRLLLNDLSFVIAPLAAEKGLSFASFVDANIARYLRCDELRLRRVLVNLLGNSIKYTDNGSVWLSAHAADGRLLLQVEDTGPGISPEDQQRLFQAFERASDAGRKPGAGLGLAISRRLSESMGGSLGIESEPGRGTRMTVDVPYQPVGIREATDTTEEPGQAGPEATLAGGRLVVGEDDEDLAALLELQLTRAGYEFMRYPDGRAAVEAALRDRPSLVLLDLNMPVLDGIGAARELRERGYSGPILALSAGHDRERVARALASGCTDFLRKPVGAGRLLEKIEQLHLAKREGLL